MSKRPAHVTTSERVSVVTDTPIPRLFDYLTIPSNHVRLDGSGQLLSAGDQPITGVGDVFTVEMDGGRGEDYQIENHVVAFVPDVHIGWMPARPGGEPVGIRWDWEFDVGPRGQTMVIHSCDWSAADGQAFLAAFRLPGVSAEAMRLSVRRLIDLVSSFA